MKRLFSIILVAAAAVTAVNADDTRWVSGKDLKLIGTIAPDATNPYTRLPDSLKATAREEIWDLGQNSAGLALRFRSDATTLKARWRSHKRFNMNHMTATGIRGLDLYTRDSLGRWTTLGPARPALYDSLTTATIVSGLPKQMREYMLYLSLYDGVDSVSVGVDSAAVVLPPAVDSPRSDGKIVMYGTSLLQGGCASRPGMAYSNILERELDREIINLGFSGNARLDYDIAQMIASIPNPALIVLDPLPNLTHELLTARIDTFYSIVRAGQPNTPILLVESPLFPLSRFIPEVNQQLRQKNQDLTDFYNKIVEAGDKNVYYLKGDELYGDEWEMSVDNYHYTDVGMKRIASVMLPEIKKILK